MVECGRPPIQVGNAANLTTMHRVFIDGQAGTTGLLIQERLAERSDLDLVEIDPAERKDPRAKQAIIETADVVILCLPDDAAKETVSANANGSVRFIDASTAHRINPQWAYGLPEMLPGQRASIASARFVSNPGCYPTGFLTATIPLIEAGLLKPESLISISAISGYSGGGRQLIEKYETRASKEPDALWYARPYSLGQKHKHVPEMAKYSGLSHAPLFMPMVGHFHQGMLVSIPLFSEQFNNKVTPESISACLAARYESEPCINVLDPNHEEALQDGFLDPQGANATNRIDLMVYGNDARIVVIARLDNLGKGASGAAVQNLNLMLQLPELEGLTL